MRRYEGASLRAGARIAVVANDALGNFAVVTPLLQMLRGRHAPGALDFYSGSRVMELAEASDLIDMPVALLGVPPRSLVDPVPEPYDLVVNIERTSWAKSVSAILAGDGGYVCGPCIDPEGRGDLPFPEDARGALWADGDWAAPRLQDRYPFLESPFLGEIVCRLAYLDGAVPRYRLPSADPGRKVPPVLISTAASLTEKLWPLECWLGIIEVIVGRGLAVGLLGARPADQERYWEGADAEERIVHAGVEDLRGVLTLPQVVGAIAGAELVVSIDNGIVHLACGTETPVVGIYRHGIHRLWAPPVEGLRVVEPGLGGSVADVPIEAVEGAMGDVFKGGVR